MPVVSITLLPGYDAETEQRLVRRVAQATRSVIAAPAAGTTVFVAHANTYQRDGRVFAGGNPAVPDAAGVVRRFLDLMQQRDLEAAARLLAPGFAMHFPGAAPMRRLEELVEWAASRYRHVAKSYAHVDQCWGDASTVVYCGGTLHGEWLDGTPFEGIRFMDRFEVATAADGAAGPILRQDVFNDIAALHPLPA